MGLNVRDVMSRDTYHTKKDSVLEIILVVLSIIIGGVLIVSTVSEFINTGKSPYMVLTIWFVAQTWYWMYGGSKR